LTKSEKKFVVVLVTAPNRIVARKLAGAALKAKLIACANLLDKIESHYWWHNKIEKGNETLMLLKTTMNHLKPLEKLIVSMHPYDTPELLVLKVNRGNKRYLDWLSHSVK